MIADKDDGPHRPGEEDDLRILVVAPFFEPAWRLGGMATAAAASAYALAATGATVNVLTTSANGNCELDITTGEPQLRQGTQVTYLPRWRWSGNRYISPALYENCSKQISTYDAIYTIGLWTFPSTCASWIASRTNTPFVASTHGTLMPWAYKRHGWVKKLFMNLVERQRLEAAEAVICSTSTEEKNVKLLGLNIRTVTIPNVVYPINVEPSVSRNRFRAKYKLNNATVMIFSGRLVTNKGVHLTIAAFRNIAERYPDTHLLLVGPSEDDSVQLIRQQVQKMNLQDKVHFLGLLSGNDYWDAIVGSDLFILNSFSENFGMAPAEALALGVPVLLSDQVGIAEYVQQYNAGIVAPLSVPEIAKSMALMLESKDNLRKMGAQGSRLVKENFSPEVVGRDLKQLFNDIVIQKQV